MSKTINQPDLNDIYRIFHLTIAVYFEVHREHLQSDILGHRTSLNNLKRIEVILSMFSGHSGIKLEINSRKISAKSSDIWTLNSTFLNHSWVKEGIKREIRRCELNENEITNMTICGMLLNQ